MNSSENLNITVPKSYTSDPSSEVLFKIQPNKQIKEKIHTFRSFCIPVSVSGMLEIQGNKHVPVIKLYEILEEHGLCKTIPRHVKLDFPIQMGDIDWAPSCYNGPTVWYFSWRDTKCSITRGNYCLYLRVHDLTLGSGEKILNEISTELVKFWIPPDDKTLKIYTCQCYNRNFQWIEYCTKLHRDPSTIYIDDEVKEKLVEQLRRFLRSRSLYDMYGITWKRVHLFHGPPGCGKTSMSLALASLFGYNIAKLTITPDLNSQDLEKLFQNVPNKTFLLLEDVDALFTERKANTSIDFSTLLNCMDGITTKPGLICIMITNYLEKLDEAFIRPGRVDCLIEFKKATVDDLRKALKVLAKDYEEEHEEFLRKNGDISIPQLQQYLFECVMDERKSIL